MNISRDESAVIAERIWEYLYSAFCANTKTEDSEDDDETGGSDDADCSSESIGATRGGYEVYSKATQNDNDGDAYYYLPIPGTGTAGNSRDCSLAF